MRRGTEDGLMGKCDGMLIQLRTRCQLVEGMTL